MDEPCLTKLFSLVPVDHALRAWRRPILLLSGLAEDQLLHLREPDAPGGHRHGDGGQVHERCRAHSHHRRKDALRERRLRLQQRLFGPQGDLQKRGVEGDDLRIGADTVQRRAVFGAVSDVLYER